MGAEYLCLTQEEHCVTRIDNYVGESVSQFCGEQRNPNPDVLVIIARAVEQARTMPRPACKGTQEKEHCSGESVAEGECLIRSQKKSSVAIG